MSYQNSATYFSLKQTLVVIAGVFAVAATLLIILLTSAATAIGSDPVNAITLTDGVNTGILGIGEQRWFRVMPVTQNEGAQVEKSFTFIFSSPEDAPLSQYVAMQLFNEDQVQQINSSTMFDQIASLGSGQLVSDDNPETDTLLWTGSLSNRQTTYILIRNSSDFSLDYQLIADDVIVQVAEVAEAPKALVATTVDVDGTSPGDAILLESGTNAGVLQPKTKHWYTFVQSQVGNNNPIQDREFTLFFTPDDGNRRHYVNFELFTASEIDNWLNGNQSNLTHFGAGMLLSRDGDIKTGERLWSGTVVNGDKYYVAVENASDVEIDYWLFTDDVTNANLGPEPVPAPPPVYAEGAAPQTAIPISFDQNTGGLDPGQEVWYSFSIQDDDNEVFEELKLTMIMTPDNGNRIHNVTFDVFTVDSVKNWSPGINTQIQNLGAGSLVVRDNNDLTGERFWSGWVVENEIYYVQIRNGADSHIDYWLFTDDVYGPELGQVDLQ